MAYPTGVNFQHTSGVVGAQPIHEVSSSARHALGSVVRAKDITYGEGEFIYCLGVASTAQGDLVAYNSKTGATVRAVAAGTGSQGPVGVAASANTSTSAYGWVQVSGSAPVSAATAAADADVYLTSTAGQVDDLVNVGDKVDGAAFKAATSGGFATVQLNRPSVAAESGTAGLIAAQADIVTAQAAVDAIEALGFYCTLSAAAPVGDAVTVTGQVKTLAGVNVAVAKEVMVRALAATADEGDIAVTTGTAVEIVNPATGENIAWILTTAAGAFAFTVTNTAATDVLVSAVAPDGLVAQIRVIYPE